MRSAGAATRRRVAARSGRTAEETPSIDECNARWRGAEDGVFREGFTFRAQFRVTGNWILTQRAQRTQRRDAVRAEQAGWFGQSASEACSCGIVHVLTFCIAAASRDSCETRGCRRVELRALCDKVPRTPPGP